MHKSTKSSAALEAGIFLPPYSDIDSDLNSEEESRLNQDHRTFNERRQGYGAIAIEIADTLETSPNENAPDDFLPARRALLECCGSLSFFILFPFAMMAFFIAKSEKRDLNSDGQITGSEAYSLGVVISLVAFLLGGIIFSLIWGLRRELWYPFCSREEPVLPPSFNPNPPEYEEDVKKWLEEDMPKDSHGNEKTIIYEARIEEIEKCLMSAFKAKKEILMGEIHELFNRKGYICPIMGTVISLPVKLGENFYEKEAVVGLITAKLTSLGLHQDHKITTKTAYCIPDPLVPSTILTIRLIDLNTEKSLQRAIEKELDRIEKLIKEGNVESLQHYLEEELNTCQHFNARSEIISIAMP
ncbi:MAG: hypothetical protein K0R12_533 [Gammaproteobacteria bacterium]|jgi:hypothetical protein|nr:hypothetical protein [Gammaproteobacteria bacterium]